MTLELLTTVALVLAAIPFAMVAMNLFLYRRPRVADRADDAPPVSVLIPARNEEGSIRDAVESALASRGVEIEVVVLDDQSEDRTASIVREIAARDERVRLETSRPLPEGWCGKQFACHQLASAARHDRLVFVDADVRLAPHALRDMTAFLERSGSDLISGIPRQITGSPVERLVIPLVHFVLLGFLPLVGMRLTRRPAFAAGCGQLFMARRDAYVRAGGHEAIRETRHDGIRLPRAFRAAGLRTDLFDATAAATCRMYRNGADVWLGFAKNATEGMASAGAILPWTVLLGGGQILPWLLLAPALAAGGAATTFAATGAALGLVTRSVLAVRFRQSWTGVLLHPVGVAVVLAIQWYALARRVAGRELEWKGRIQVEG